MTAAAPYRVDIKTDEHGTYEERWMVPPPAPAVGDTTTYEVTACAWVTETCQTCDGLGKVRSHIDQREMREGRGYGWWQCRNPTCVNGCRRVRVIHEWKAVEKRREL
jgi:hypothetical protein